MDSLHDVEQNSLLRGVGPRQASVKANAAARARVPIASPSSNGKSSGSRTSRRRKGADAPLLAPLGSARGAPTQSLLAVAAATPTLQVPAALYSAKQLWHGELNDSGVGSADAPGGGGGLSLSHHAHYIAQIWRETRQFTRQQQQARAEAEQAKLAAMKAKKEGGIGTVSETKEEKQPASTTSTLPTHRPSFALFNHPPVLPVLPPAPETLTSIDSLLNPHSIVHVAAALSVEHLQRAELTRNVSLKRQVSTQAVQTAQKEALTDGERREKQLHYGPQHMAKQASMHHQPPANAQSNASIGSPRTARQSRKGLYASGSATSRAFLTTTASSDRFSPPRNGSPGRSASKTIYGISESAFHHSSPGAGASSNHSLYAQHVLGLYNAWQQQLAFMAQDLFAAKCMDLGLVPTVERRDKFIARILEQGAKDGVLRLLAQGLQRQSARAIVGFLRRVQAFAAPTPEEREAKRTVREGGSRGSRGSREGGTRARSTGSRQSTRQGGAGGGHRGHRRTESVSHDASPAGSHPGSRSGSSDEDDTSDEEHDRAMRQQQEHMDHEEFLKRSFESSNSPASRAHKINQKGTESNASFSFPALDEAGGIVTGTGTGVTVDGESKESSSTLPSPSPKDSVSAFIHSLHGSAGVPPGMLRDISEGGGANDIQDGYMDEYDLNQEDLARARKRLGFQRKFFHAVDLTGNNLGDDGMLELSVLFLPNPQQIQKAEKQAQYDQASKVERKRLRKERRAQKKKAKEMGLDLAGGEDETDTLYPLSGLKTLILRSNNLTSQGFAVIFDSLAHQHAPLTFLDLGANSVVSSNAVVPGAAHSHGSGGGGGSSSGGGGTSGGAIGLGNMFIGLEGCHSLGGMLLKNSTLKTLLLSNVGLGTVPGGMDFLSAGLAGNKTLAVLDLSANRLDGRAGNDVATLFHSLRSSAITDLNVSHNPLGSLGAHYVALYLSSSSIPGQTSAISLSKLRMEHCSIGVGGLAFLSKAMEYCGNLNDFSLDGNCFSALETFEADHTNPVISKHIAALGLGEEIVSPALATNLSLHTLSMNQCAMDDRVVIELCTALAAHCTLHTVSLRSNKIGDAGGQALGGLLRVNHVINQLDLYMNFIGDSGGIAIAKALALPGSSLNSLNLQNNNLTNQSAEWFIHSLHVTPSLAALQIDGNQIDYPYYHQLDESVKRNKKHWSLVGLQKQHGLIRRLLRDKAKFTEVSIQRDQAALHDRKNAEYLRELQSGQKFHKNSELNVTEELQAELNKLKLENLEIHSAIRQANQALAQEGNKREGKIHELHAALNVERNHSTALRKKLKKGNESLSFQDTKKSAGVQQPMVVDVERSNVETILRLETKKLDQARMDASATKMELESFIAKLQKALIQHSRRGSSTGSTLRVGGGRRSSTVSPNSNSLQPSPAATPAASKPGSRRGSFSIPIRSTQEQQQK